MEKQHPPKQDDANDHDGKNNGMSSSNSGNNEPPQHIIDQDQDSVASSIKNPTHKTTNSGKGKTEWNAINRNSQTPIFQRHNTTGMMDDSTTTSRQRRKSRRRSSWMSLRKQRGDNKKKTPDNNNSKEAGGSSSFRSWRSSHSRNSSHSHHNSSSRSQESLESAGDNKGSDKDNEQGLLFQKDHDGTSRNINDPQCDNDDLLLGGDLHICHDSTTEDDETHDVSRDAFGSISSEYRKSMVQPESRKRRSTKLLEQTLTINKLRFDDLGLYGRDDEITLLQTILQKVTNHKDHGKGQKSNCACQLGDNSDAVCNHDEEANVQQSSLTTTTAPQTSLSSSGQHDPSSNSKSECSPSINKSDYKRHLVLVKGHSGTGKSRLVVEALQQSARQRGGIFISGKCDFSRGGEPYTGIAAACGALCGELLLLNRNEYGTISESSTCSEDEVETNENKFQVIRDRLVTELGIEIGILIKFVPILEEIVGEDAAIASQATPNATTVRDSSSSSSSSGDDWLATIAPSEAKYRFQYAFKRFLRVITSVYSVCCILWDDLQWADSASLELLQVLMTDRDNARLMIVGCYRGNEVEEGHLLHTTLHELQQHSTQYVFGMTVISLDNLTLKQVNHWLMDLLDTYESETLGLAQICHKKTFGNPFFLKSFLELLHQQLLLEYNLGITRWVWDDDEIEAKTQATNNVVDLMVLRMKTHTICETQLLQVAASLGAVFSQTVLQRVWRKMYGEGEREERERTLNGFRVTTHEADSESNYLDIAIEQDDDSLANVIQLLHMAVAEGYLEPTARTGEFRWVHDKIQESALSLASPEQLRALQARIGSILVSELAPRELASTIFVAVNLLNEGPPPNDRTEAIRRAQLNLQAAEKAVDLSAIESSAKYALIGIDCLPEDCLAMTSPCRRLALKLYSVATEAEGMLGRIEALESHSQVVLERTDIPLSDKLRVYNALLDSMANRNLVVESRDLCREVLKSLGCTFPWNPLVLRLRNLFDLRKLQKDAKLRTPEALAKAPTMKDSSRIGMMKLMEKLVTYCYITSMWDMYVQVCLREVQWTDKYGLSEVAPHAFSCAGLILSNMCGNLQKGSIYGEHTLRILEKLKKKRLEASGKFVVYCFVLHWTQPSHTTLKPLLQAYEAGMESGNIEYAVYAVVPYIGNSFQSGRGLESLESDCRKFIQTLRDLKRDFSANNCAMIWQTVLNLMGRSEHQTLLTGEAMDEPEFRRTLIPFHQALLRASMRCINTWFGDYEQVAKLFDEDGFGLAKVYPGSILVCMDFFLIGISFFALARRHNKNARYAKYGKKSLATMKEWVERGNPNVRHYEALLEAELSAFNRKVHVANKNFEVAIALASRGGFIQDAALANERYGDFLLEQGDEKEAEFRLSEAIKLYDEWGAKAKVLHRNCIVDHFNALATGTQSTHVIVQELRHRLNDLTEVFRYEQMRTYEMPAMAATIQTLKNHFIPPDPDPTPVPSKGVTKFSVTSKSLSKNSSIAGVTTKFLVDNYPVGFALDKESDLWKDLRKDQRKKLCNQFAALKCAVRMMLLHAESHRPNSDKRSIASMAKIAAEKIRNDFGFDKTENITVYKVQKHAKTKQLQASLQFPANTPEHIF